jgi:hypothetical protein
MYVQQPADMLETDIRSQLQFSLLRKLAVSPESGMPSRSGKKLCVERHEHS